MAAMTDDTKMPPKVLNNNKVLRSSQSAIAPERNSKEKEGSHPGGGGYAQHER
tara:strand:+ start:527 stop:685 length:159 start_codon:yes stop_codon:yes gene_type:complete